MLGFQFTRTNLETHGKVADTQNEALLSRKAYKTVQLVFTQKWPLGGADGFRLFLASHNISFF